MIVNGYTQKEIAKKLQIHQDTITRWIKEILVLIKSEPL